MSHSVIKAFYMILVEKLLEKRKYTETGLYNTSFYQLGPSAPSWSSIRDVCLSVCLMSLLIFFSRPLIGPQSVTGSTRQQTVGRINKAADRWQDQPGSRPLSGSTRQQTVVRINQASDRWQYQPVADRGDGR